MGNDKSKWQSFGSVLVEATWSSSWRSAWSRWGAAHVVGAIQLGGESDVGLLG